MGLIWLILYSVILPWNSPLLAILLIILSIILQIKYTSVKKQQYTVRNTETQRFSNRAIYVFIVGLLLLLYWGWRVLLPHNIFYNNDVSKVTFHGYYHLHESNIEANKTIQFRGEITNHEEIKQLLLFFNGYISIGAAAICHIKPVTIELWKSDGTLINKFYLVGMDGGGIEPFNPSFFNRLDLYRLEKQGLYEWLFTHSGRGSGTDH